MQGLLTPSCRAPPVYRSGCEKLQAIVTAYGLPPSRFDAAIATAEALFNTEVIHALPLLLAKGGLEASRAIHRESPNARLHLLYTTAQGFAAAKLRSAIAPAAPQS